MFLIFPLPLLFSEFFFLFNYKLFTDIFLLGLPLGIKYLRQILSGIISTDRILSKVYIRYIFPG